MAKYLKALFATSAVAATALNAEIVLAENLSLSGYIDMGATDYDSPSGTDSFSADIYQVEMAFNFTTDTYSAVAEFAYDGSHVEYETITITYAATEELSFTAGNILSYLGWETYDATGLYQFSYAYRDFTPLYPAYAVGASIDYVTDAYSVWVGEGSSEKVSVEVAAKYTGVENLTLFAGYANDPGYETINFWGSYEMGDFTFALEWINVDHEDYFLTESTGYLAMINYAMGDFGVTFRYSIENDDLDALFAAAAPDEAAYYEENWELFTIAPSYAFSDNLLGLVEFSYILDGGFDGDSESDFAWAVELLYTF